MATLNFSQVGDRYEAQFSKSDAFNLHIEFIASTPVSVTLYATTKSGGRFGKQWETNEVVIDKDFLPLRSVCQRHTSSYVV